MRKTAKYYAANPKARKKRVKAQAKINRKPKEKKRRAELAKERRKRGVMGKGGKDVSHKRNGKTFLESRSKNRARNGHGTRRKRA
ncbi:MAG: hypothetical protein GY879_09220 [Planctomycetes bacterium]|nr:hypothetical protein [Planctomycetota bacterium]